MEIPRELTQWLHDARAGCPDARNELATFATSYLLHAKGCPISSHWQAQEDRYDLVQDTLRRFFQHSTACATSARRRRSASSIASGAGPG